jgi:hypothetical protein
MSVKAKLLALYSIRERTILIVNAILGAAVVVAHGGALLMVQRQRRSVVLEPSELEALVRNVSPFTIPVAALVVLSSVLGLLGRRPSRLLLQVQSAVVVVASAASLVWTAGLAIHRIPESNFSWSPGFLTVWVAYGAYLAVRFILPSRWVVMTRFAYVPLLAAALALPIDMAIFVRVIVSIFQTLLAGGPTIRINVRPGKVVTTSGNESREVGLGSR